MSLRQYLLIMAMATLICYVAFGYVVYNVDPEETEMIGFVFFYLSAFFSLLGTFSLVWFALYMLFSKHELPLFMYVEKSFFSSFFLSATAVGVLMLEGKGWLTLWNACIFGIVFVLFISLIISIRSTARE